MPVTPLHRRAYEPLTPFELETVRKTLRAARGSTMSFDKLLRLLVKLGLPSLERAELAVKMFLHPAGVPQTPLAMIVACHMPGLDAADLAELVEKHLPGTPRADIVAELRRQAIAHGEQAAALERFDRQSKQAQQS